jgi:polyisoprenoid-binding protein YceI
MTNTNKTNWAIDANHSQIQFKVKHLMISNVSGTFKKFSGTVSSPNNDFTDAEINFEIDSNSVDTNQPERDTHLKSPLFLNTEKFPQIIFKGQLQKTNGAHQLVGNLTLCDATKNISMPVTFNGIGIGRFNDTRAGFELNSTINRKDFGLNFSLLTDTGSIVVGEEIKLYMDIQLIQQLV